MVRSVPIALGAIGSDEALEAMVDALTTGEERLRQAVAEAFASLPDEGYPILYDAIHHEEMMIRRAAVFGLRRLRTSWALIAIYRAMLEDDQWYVRSAAQQAFQDIQQAEIHGIRGYPPPENIPWLLQWVGEMGEDAPQEASADDLLLLALRDGEQNIRQLSATVMGQLGMLSTFDDLYAMLSAPEAPLRDAAHRALSDLQMQTGYPLPAPS